VMISGQLIANHAFAAMYINMVVCECLNELAFALWIAPVTYLWVDFVKESTSQNASAVIYHRLVFHGLDRKSVKLDLHYGRLSRTQWP
jgi:hypothetical protein